MGCRVRASSFQWCRLFNSWDKTNADDVAEKHTYDGSGGLNQFFITNGYSPFKNFSIGATASYCLVPLTRKEELRFPDLSNYFNTRITQENSVGSLYFNFGMQLAFDSLRLAPSDSIKMLDKKLGSLHDSLEVLRTMSGKSTVPPLHRCRWCWCCPHVTLASPPMVLPSRAFAGTMVVLRHRWCCSLAKDLRETRWRSTVVNQHSISLLTVKGDATKLGI